MNFVRPGGEPTIGTILPAPTTTLGDIRRLLAVAVVLPAVIVVVDQLAVAVGTSQPLILILLPALFVAQVGILGFCSGRFVENAFVRCIVFTWSIVLVDCVAFTSMFVSGTALKCMTFAMLSGEIGLLTIWGILSRMAWPWRIPIFLVILSLFVVVMMRSSVGIVWETFEVWTVMLTMQSVIMVAICSILRFFDYRLLPIHHNSATAQKQFQFSIRHLIVWTTAVCPVLAVATGVDWLLLDARGLFDTTVLFRTTTLGLAFAIVSGTTMYSALGRHPLRYRLLVLFVIPPLIGVALLGLISTWNVGWNTSGRFFWEIKELRWTWVAWNVLAAWFLASLLLVFRSAGYRLTHSPKR